MISSLIMPPNGKWVLIRRLKFKSVLMGCYSFNFTESQQDV